MPFFGTLMLILIESVYALSRVQKFFVTDTLQNKLFCLHLSTKYSSECSWGNSINRSSEKHAIHECGLRFFQQNLLFLQVATRKQCILNCNKKERKSWWKWNHLCFIRNKCDGIDNPKSTTYRVVRYVAPWIHTFNCNSTGRCNLEESWRENRRHSWIILKQKTFILNNRLRSHESINCQHYAL